MTLISVIMPLHNAANYVQQTIESVLKQTHKDLELIVVNDGSTDAGPRIVEALMAQDPRIKMYNKPNGGAATARNQALQIYKGEYVAFIDSDDLWEPTKLERQLAYFQSNSELGLVYCASWLIDPNGKKIGTQDPKCSNLTAWDILCRNPVSNGSTPVISRDCIEATSQKMASILQETYYFDLPCVQSEDAEYWFRIYALSGYQSAGIPERLVSYRIHPGGVSARLEEKQRSWERTLERVKRYYCIDDIVQSSLGYHLRYLARRAISLGDGKAALSYCTRGVMAYPFMLIQEPLKTVVTLGASGVGALFPKVFIQHIFRFCRVLSKNYLHKSLKSPLRSRQEN